MGLRGGRIAVSALVGVALVACTPVELRKEAGHPGSPEAASGVMADPGRALTAAEASGIEAEPASQPDSAPASAPAHNHGQHGETP